MKKENKPFHDRHGWRNARPVAGRPGEWVVQWDTAKRDLPPGEYPGPWHIEHHPSGCVVWCPDLQVADAGLHEAAKGPGNGKNAAAKGLWAQVLQSPGFAPRSTESDPEGSGGEEVAPPRKARQKPGKREDSTTVAAELVKLGNNGAAGQIAVTGADNKLTSDDRRNYAAKILDSIPDEEMEAAVRGALTATRSYAVGSGDGARIVTVEDFPTRLRAWELVMAYREGRPIERQQIIRADKPSRPEDLVEFLSSSREVRETMRAVLARFTD